MYFKSRPSVAAEGCSTRQLQTLLKFWCIGCHRSCSHPHSSPHLKCETTQLVWKRFQSPTHHTKVQLPSNSQLVWFLPGSSSKLAVGIQRKPEGQEIKNKALQTLWKEAPVSLIANYHSSQLPDSQRLRPHRRLRCDALTLLSTVARQGHTSSSSTAASLQGGLNEERNGRKKNTLGFIYTWKFLWMLNNELELGNTADKLAFYWVALLRATILSLHKIHTFGIQESQWFGVFCWISGIAGSQAKWPGKGSRRGKKRQPQQAGGTVLSHGPHTQPGAEFQPRASQQQGSEPMSPTVVI